MIKFQKMICATDFSEPSLRAFEFARVLAAQFSAELILTHVVDLLPATVPPIGGAPVASTLNVAEYQKQRLENATRHLDEIVRKLDGHDIVLRPHVAEGRPSAAIVQLAADEDADLIVIATHGHNRLHRFVFGSVADRVVRSAPCPVLTVGPEEKD